MIDRVEGNMCSLSKNHPCLISFQISARFTNYNIRSCSRMGNENCIGDKQHFKLNYFSQGQLTKESSTEEKFCMNCAENVGYENQEIDEGSPFSKFDIKFLKTSVRASKIKLCNKTLSSLHSFGETEGMRSFKQNRMLMEVKKSLIEWSSTLKVDSGPEKINLQGSEGWSQKYKALQDYTNFLLKAEQETKFEELKISGQVLYKIRNQPIEAYYQMRRRIGEGSFGWVYIGVCKKSGEQRAIKVIKKKSMNAEDQKLLLSEINILKKMDHINIIKLYDVFYYHNFFYVVTEYCEGGTLLEALRQNRIESEKQAMVIMKQVISAIRYMHQMKIAHRDLKLENIMLIKQSEDEFAADRRKVIKIIDFGLACKVTYTFRNKTGLVGTIDYMAPEIFLGYFSCNSDVWSCGIILCMLLIGRNPFKKKQVADTMLAIKQQQIQYNKPEWKKISKKAKDLLGLMLNKKQQKRINIQQVIVHPWLKTTEDNKQQANQIHSQMVIRNFNEFNRGNNFICFIKNFVISRELNQNIRQEMAIIFQRIDTDSSGVIEKEELMALYSIVTGVTDELIQKLINKIDQNHSGRIDFQQFLICMTQNQLMHNQEYIDRAFDFFDDDRTGFIQRKELFDCLQGCEEGQFIQIIKDLDFDGDGKVSREEFRRYIIQAQF